MKRTTYTLLIPFFTFGYFTLHAQVVDFVQWGSDYNMLRLATSPVDSTPVRGTISADYSFTNQDLGIGDAGADDSFYGNTLDSHLSGMIDAGGENLSTRTFYYAGQQIRVDGGINGGNRNIGSTSSYSTSNDWRGNGFEQYSLYAWNKADFLDNGAVDLSDPASKMEVVVRSLTNNEAGTGVHFVIQNGGTWYYSQASQTTTGTFTLNDPGSAMWGTFDPTTIGTTPRAMAMPNSGFAGVTFDDVQWVGFATESIRLTSNSESRQGYDNFVFTAAIPEPGTLTLVSLSLLLWIGFRRFR